MISKKSLWTYSVIFLVSLLHTVPIQAASVAITNKMVAAINKQRALYGLKPVVANAKLNTAAQKHSKDMATNDFFSHTGSDGSSPFTRMTRESYNYTYAMENIAAGYATVNAVVTGWMNSPGHRANILSNYLKEIGVGYVNLSTDGGSVPYHRYWTLDGGRR
jgi:uncharacterized protein YkwD